MRGPSQFCWSPGRFSSSSSSHRRHRSPPLKDPGAQLSRFDGGGVRGGVDASICRLRLLICKPVIRQYPPHQLAVNFNDEGVGLGMCLAGNRRSANGCGYHILLLLFQKLPSLPKLPVKTLCWRGDCTDTGLGWECRGCRLHTWRVRVENCPRGAPLGPLGLESCLE